MIDSNKNGHNDAGQVIAKLVALLDVEQLDTEIFRGARTDEPWSRVFGGQVIGQALVAAARTVDASRPVHSLHAYFLRAGDPQAPIIYRVLQDRDGGRFSARRVTAMQEGNPILNLAASFQRLGTGYAHQADMPSLPGPDEFRDVRTLAAAQVEMFGESKRKLSLSVRPIEFRPILSGGRLSPGKHEPVQQHWFRAISPLPADQTLQRAVLAYSSDTMLLSTSLLPHGVGWYTHEVQEASVDHALWIHDDVDLNQWLLYCQDSPWAGSGRGFTRGQIFTRHGKLIASVAQEGVIRRTNEPDQTE